MWWFLTMLACTSPTEDSGAVEAYTFPGLEARPELHGPGGPSATFTSDELFTHCAALMGGPGLPDGYDDNGYHNLVVPHRGHLLMPWAPEWGLGGLSFFDMSDPCSPVTVGHGYDESMREPHSIGFATLPEGDAHAGDYAFVAHKHGLLVWDVSDHSAPVRAGELVIDNVFWPDAYTRVVLSVFVAYPYVYMGAADNGVFVVDVTDPAAPVLASQYVFDPPLRVSGVFGFGDRLFVVPSKQERAAMLDVSNPSAPQLWPGSPFDILNGDGEVVKPYHGNTVGNYGLLTRKDGGGGPVVLDLTDPAAPQFTGEYRDDPGSGGYVFYDEGFLFQGETHYGNVYDARDLSNISLVGSYGIEGDNDTLTPYGNVALLAVDDGGKDGLFTAVVPWTENPDAAAPLVMATQPADGATGVPLTSRIGVGFNEMIEPSSFFVGGVQLKGPDGAAVEGWTSAQESYGHYAPKEPLKPGTTYTLTVLADSVTDPNGNALEEDFSIRFTTAGGGR